MPLPARTWFLCRLSSPAYAPCPPISLLPPRRYRPRPGSPTRRFPASHRWPIPRPPSISLLPTPLRPWLRICLEPPRECTRPLPSRQSPTLPASTCSSGPAPTDLSATSTGYSTHRRRHRWINITWRSPSSLRRCTTSLLVDETTYAPAWCPSLSCTTEASSPSHKMECKERMHPRGGCIVPFATVGWWMGSTSAHHTIDSRCCETKSFHSTACLNILVLLLVFFVSFVFWSRGMLFPPVSCY